MDLNDVNERVLRIAAASGDDEHQHSSEDDLYRDVLRAIADGAPNAAELATAALKSQTLHFSRWSA